MTTKSHSSRVATQRSASHEWETPRALFERLHVEFAFTVDGAALDHNARLPRYWTPYSDGLGQSWEGERVFVNPPFGKEIANWTRKASREVQRGCPLAVLLVPVRSDTAWWHETVLGRAEVRFLRGRVKFEQRGMAKDAAPFPCCLLIYRGVSA